MGRRCRIGAVRRSRRPRCRAPSRVSLVTCSASAVAACASARLRRETTVSLARRRRAGRRGCHACLLEALAIYQRLQPRDADHASARRPTSAPHLAAAGAARKGNRARRARRISSARERWRRIGHRRRSRAARARRPRPVGLGRCAARDTDAAVPARVHRPGSAHRAADARARCVGRRGARRLSRPLARLHGPAQARSRLSRPRRCCRQPRRARCCSIAWARASSNEEPRLRAALDAEPRFAEVWFFLGRNRLVTPEGPPQAAARGPAPALRGGARGVRPRRTRPFPSRPPSRWSSPTRRAPSAIAMRCRSTSLSSTRVPEHQDAWFGKALCETYLAAAARGHREPHDAARSGRNGSPATPTTGAPGTGIS